MSKEQRKLVLVAGPSGAGLSTATAALQDVGFEVIDNMPLRFAKPLLDQPWDGRPMSLSLDTRNRDFSTHAALDLFADLQAHDGIDVQLLFLDCSPDELARRYSTTRRPHPFADAANVMEAVDRESALLAPMRSRADVLIDTSEMSPHDLRAQIKTWFAEDDAGNMAVQVQSFSYKRGLPRSADMVFDCRFLQNPYWKEDLRSQTGLDAGVQKYVSSDARFAKFFDMVRGMCLFMLPAARSEGKSYLSIACGCTGGRHRSVTVAERLSHALAEQGWQVSIRHRELERRPSGDAQP